MAGDRRILFSSLLFTAMGMATFTAASLGILASFVIDDLSMTRAQLGIVVAVVNVAAAALSPLAGRLIDRVGGRVALVALFSSAGATFLILGTAVTYPMLLVGALAGALSQASANPATNRLIAEVVPAGRRGIITGIKQSGVQAGIFLGGVTVPSLAIALGWRVAYLVIAAAPLLLAVATRWLVPTESVRRAAAVAAVARPPLPAAIWWLTGYGLLMGFSGSVTYLVPLFTEEALGRGPVAGGLAAATIALVAVPGRILWSRHAERSDAFREALAAMAVLSLVADGLFFAASEAVGWLLWPAAVFIAVGSSSWNSVGMLAVMVEAGIESTGRASGFVLLGFLSGLGTGPPIYGALVDATGSYDGMWILSAVAALGALTVVAVWRRKARRGAGGLMRVT
jgi:MFS family permease